MSGESARLHDVVEALIALGPDPGLLEIAELMQGLTTADMQLVQEKLDSMP